MTSNRQQTEANFTWLLNNERFVDVIVLIATNGEDQESALTG
jgi:hypothetical protein